MQPDPTTEYFESHVHDYGQRRLQFAIEKLKELAEPDSSLLDVGCGTGTLLKLLNRETDIDDLTGMDVSANTLTIAQERLGCETLQASILDADLTSSIPRRFDFVVMAAVLHHLVGGSRRRSREMAVDSLKQALALLSVGGHLVIVEPTFTPHWAMSLVFFVKRHVSRLTGRRIEILGRWNNLGAPVVSYYSPTELDELIAEAGAEIVDAHEAEGKLRWLPRLLGITGRWETTLIARRTSD